MYSINQLLITNQHGQKTIPKEAPWKTLVLNEQSYKGLRIQYRYVWNKARARLRWNRFLPVRPFSENLKIAHNKLILPFHSIMLKKSYCKVNFTFQQLLYLFPFIFSCQISLHVLLFHQNRSIFSFYRVSSFSANAVSYFSKIID